MFLPDKQRLTGLLPGLFSGPDRKYGSDFDPAVVEEIAAAGIYVCPTMTCTR